MLKFLSDISPKMFLLILALVSSLLIAAITSYILLPQYKSYVKANKSFSLLNISIDTVNYQQEMDRNQAVVNILKKQINGEGNQLPFKQFESHVISQLQKLVWNNDAELGGVRPRTGKQFGHYHEVLFDVDISGEYFDLYQLLLDFEQSMEFTIINELRISPQTTALQEPALNIQMTIASYREKLL